MFERSETRRVLKKLILLIAAGIAIGLFIKNLVKHHMEIMQKISGVTDDDKEYTSSFESKEYTPGCSFKGGGIRSMFSSVTFNLADLKTEDDLSVTCNAIGSVVELKVPADINVVTIDISKASAVHNGALAPFDSDKKTLKVYISGFMSVVLIKNS